eukprot:Blabericola_migrator_1__6983@NODE_353_length_9489_cov_72_242518_g276_i1_p3_GENE_NODE_353_length_9489_cov_72_242518_g276_i1NODE_353_length_9489_cov_72_242518_g276_i1_p3_ORF_typecomplete_len310_score60_02FBPase/PF00316_20/5_9e33_NODE_353_length_9489_cov_72_242518_g276_i148825811
MTDAVQTKVLEVTQDQDLAECVATISATCADIADLLRNTLVSSVHSVNAFGDEQLTVDTVAEDKMWKCVADKRAHVSHGASEESPKLTPTGNNEGKYLCTWDPLDGSSIIACNWSVGTIVAISTLPTSLDKLVGQKPSDHMKASIIAIYGPRLSIVVGLGSRCLEFTLLKSAFVTTNDNIRIGTGKKFFAPANLRAAATHQGYHDYVTTCIKETYTLRYSGGLVPDVYHILCKGSGVFTNPMTEEAPAKLRFLYESIPLSHIVESAGGLSCDSAGNRILDMAVEGMDQRTSLVCGVKEEVEKCLLYIKH